VQEENPRMQFDMISTLAEKGKTVDLTLVIVINNGIKIEIPELGLTMTHYQGPDSALERLYSPCFLDPRKLNACALPELGEELRRLCHVESKVYGGIYTVKRIPGNTDIQILNRQGDPIDEKQFELLRDCCQQATDQIHTEWIELLSHWQRIVAGRTPYTPMLTELLKLYIDADVSIYDIQSMIQNEEITIDLLRHEEIECFGQQRAELRERLGRWFDNTTMRSLPMVLGKSHRNTDHTQIMVLPPNLRNPIKKEFLISHASN